MANQMSSSHLLEDKEDDTREMQPVLCDGNAMATSVILLHIAQVMNFESRFYGRPTCEINGQVCRFVHFFDAMNRKEFVDSTCFLSLSR